MRRFPPGEAEDEFWPAYTDILMVTSLILVMLVVSFVITRSDNHLQEELKARKAAFAQAFGRVMREELVGKTVRLYSPEGERQVITFSDQLLFEPGEAALKPSGLQALSRLSGLLRGTPGRPQLYGAVKVNGHTDEDPIETVTYPSNWHLSGARATSVVYFLVQNGLPPETLSATGYAEFHDRDPDDVRITDKARKRRIEIEVLYPMDWLAKQEKRQWRAG